MDRDAAARQGQIAQRAFLTLGNRDAAVAFLNSHDETLGHWPIDAAVASAEGLAAAERPLADRAAAPALRAASPSPRP